MPVTATVLKKGSTIPGEEFACAQVNLSFFHIHENAKIRHIFNNQCDKMLYQSKVDITGFEGGQGRFSLATFVFVRTQS